MFTRCPSCSTTFRVTPEQLKARLGRVRCGQCQAVFNALDALVEEAITVQPPVAGGSVPSLTTPPQEESLTPSLTSADTDAPATEEVSPELAQEPLAESPEDTPATEELGAEPPIEIEETEAAPEVTADSTDTPSEALEVPEADSLQTESDTEAETAPVTEEAPLLTDIPEEIIAFEEAAPVEAATALQPHGLIDIAVEPRHIDAANEPLPVFAEEAPSTSTVSIEVVPVTAETIPDTPTSEQYPIDNPDQEAAPLPEDPSAPAIEIEVVPTASLQASNDPLLNGVKETIEPVVLRPTETTDGTAVTTPDLTELMHQAVPLLHKRAPRRWPWSIGIGLGIVAVIVQIALLYRMELASMKPGLKPALQSLCQPVGCTVPLPHKIELLSIETSDLHPGTQKGQLQLSATLKNKASFAQEYPLLEVTLTDVADRSLIVKAIPAADYLPKELKVDGGFPPRREINVSLTFDIGDIPAVGYRVYLYHP